MLGRVSRVDSPTSQLLSRHSDFPPTTSGLPHCRFPLSRESMGSLLFPGIPFTACLVLRPRRDRRNVRRRAAALSLLSAMLPSGPYCPVGSRDFHISRPNHTTRSLAVYASPTQLLETAQDSLPTFGADWSDGTSTRWDTSPGFCCLAYMTSSRSRLSGRTVRIWGSGSAAQLRCASKPRGPPQREHTEGAN